MTRPFSDGVTALDEALIEEPVFKSEVGLSHRRVKLERAFGLALRAYLESVRASVADVEVVRELIADLPEARPASNGTKGSRY